MQHCLPGQPLRRYQIGSGVRTYKKRKLSYKEAGSLGQEYIANSMAKVEFGPRSLML